MFPLPSSKPDSSQKTQYPYCHLYVQSRRFDDNQPFHKGEYCLLTFAFLHRVCEKSDLAIHQQYRLIPDLSCNDLARLSNNQTHAC